MKLPLKCIGLASLGLFTAVEDFGAPVAQTDTASPYSAMVPDPDLFTWINYEDDNDDAWGVHPGGKACGWLNAPLGSDPAKSYPKVQVYICMKFAGKQPASKGTIFQHCGGPGSVTECLENGADRMWGLDVDTEMAENFNFAAIDQRGLGRSKPLFSVPECYFPCEKYSHCEEVPASKSDPNKILDPPPPTFRVGVSPYNDQDNEAQLREGLSMQGKRMANCWEAPSFILTAPDGSKYHWLDYSGTLQLAEDIDRFRQAIGAEKLSLYGLSYGTQVMSTYASVFPNHVDRYVTDGNVDPIPDLPSFSDEAAAAAEVTVNRAASICNDLNRGPLKQGLSKCSVLNQKSFQCYAAFFDKLNQLAEENKTYGIDIDFGKAMAGVGTFIQTSRDSIPFFSKLGSFCAAALNQQDDKFVTLLLGFGFARFNSTSGSLMGAWSLSEIQKKFDGEPPPSTPPPITTPSGWHCSEELGDNAEIAQTLIMGQVTSGGTQSEEYYISRWRKVRGTFSGLNTRFPSLQFTWYQKGFNWPRTHPVAPQSSPSIAGMILANTYDSSTSYKWSQKMHQAFPRSNLMTGNFMNHGTAYEFLPTATGGDYKQRPPYGWVPSKTNDCLKPVLEYYKTGKRPHNGHSCGGLDPLEQYDDLYNRFLCRKRTKESNAQYYPFALSVTAVEWHDNCGCSKGYHRESLTASELKCVEGDASEAWQSFCGTQLWSETYQMCVEDCAIEGQVWTPGPQNGGRGTCICEDNFGYDLASNSCLSAV